MPPSSRELVAARIEELSPGAWLDVSHIQATAEYAAEMLLADGHLSVHEARVLAATLEASGDFVPAEAQLVVRLLRELPDELLATPARQWAAVLAPWLLGYPAGGDQNTAYDFSTLTYSALTVRWPLPVDPDRRSTRVDEVSWTATQLQIGRPSSIDSMTIRWRDIDTIELVDPWPDVLLGWRRAAPLEALRLQARGDREAFADRVAELVRVARETVSRPDERIREGWLAAAEVEWEPVERWPADPDPRRAGYREASREPEVVVATRERRGALGALLRWLAAATPSPFRHHVGEALLTEAYLYVRRRSGTIERVPRGALRSRRGGPDAVYVFGRRTEALFTDRFACPVCEQLDAQLDAIRRAR